MSFRPINRQTDYLFPPSMNDWLPEKHLARFVVETVEEFDLTRFVSAYRGNQSTISKTGREYRKEIIQQSER